MTSPSIKTVKEVELKSARVIMRVDFNVPLNDAGEITDDTRIRAALPTIKYVLEQGASAVLMSHLGRPKGKVAEAMRLAPVAARLEKLLGAAVTMAPDCVGPEVEKLASDLAPGQVLLLENLRFHKEETDNDPEFAKKLAALGTLYVNDAFGTAHRAHASTEGVAHYLPAVSGFLLQKEVETLQRLLENPERPFAAVLGGAKVSDKIGVLQKLTEVVDTLVIGGGMAYTFLHCQGRKIGISIFQPEQVEIARQILKSAEARGVKILLPTDHLIAQEMKIGAVTQIADADIPDGWGGFDIGPMTISLFTKELLKSKTVFWNGPMGAFEIPEFANGTKAVAACLADSGAYVVVGGGDSVAAVNQMGAAGKMGHISTGGGASLEMMEGIDLPGIAALRQSSVGVS
ncbi:MAG: phosphoglycerate kinase [Candidatus Omnitrophica bacterium]|nr:phosphoglycerate kinase [Candidatus Omnitrophota bacterium]